MEDFNSKIIRLRKEQGLKQSDIANIIGISQTAYAKIESGKTKSISIETGKGIASALDVSFNDLFEVEDLKRRMLQQSILRDNETLKKINSDLKGQLEDKTRLVQFISRDLLMMKNLIMNWIEEHHISERDFLKSEYPDLSEDSEGLKSKLAVSFDREAEFLELFVKNGFISMEEVEERFQKDHYKSLMDRFKEKMLQK